MVSLRSGKKSRPHLGLGLYIVRSIVKHHQGDVQVENLNEKNEGVCFIVTLPQSFDP